MNQYIQAEKKLAQMLGVLDKWENAQNEDNGNLKWTTDSNEAFKLLVIYNLELNYVKELAVFEPPLPSGRGFLILRKQPLSS